MPATNILIKNGDPSEIKNILYKFSRQRKYIWDLREVTVHGTVIAIYDKKPDSSGFISFIETFASRLFVADRIKLEIKIKQEKEDCEVSISGTVMMAEMDIVNPDPRPASIVRLNHVLGEIASVLTP